MKEFLESIFKLGYTQYKGQGTGNGIDVQKSIRELTNNIRQIASKSGFQTEFSVGIGRWSAVPWIRVFYSDISPSAQDGVYIVYLFDASGKSAFITLNQGTTDSSIEKRNRTRKIIQEKVSSRQFSKNQGNLSFGDNKNYGAAAIFYKEYKSDNIPSEDEINNDLISLLEIYKECREKGLLTNQAHLDEMKTIQQQTNDSDNKEETMTNNSSGNFTITDFVKSEVHSRYILSLLAKPFVILSGNSGTGKTRIALRFAKYLEKQTDTEITNTLLIPVGADWTDNTKILGYFNPLANDGKGEYVKSEILSFLELAKENPSIPFFLILDEMNLSHVERYFSDFLSAMESGEPILLYKKLEDCECVVPEKITLPENLFVTGTVNIDETTYMFSPKVLDRANVIEFKPEMKDVLDNLISGASSDEQKTAESGVAEGFMELANKIRNGDVPDELKNELEKIKPVLESIYKILEKSGFEFAYRTAKEIRLYAIASYETCEDKSQFNINSVIDQQIVQKILPKIHGNKKQIGSMLAELKTELEKNEDFELSQAKVSSIIDKLEKYQYASFI